MRCEEAEQYLYYAMTIGEQLLISGAEVGRVEDTIRRICLAYGAERVDVFSITSSIVTTMYGEFGICTQTRRVRGMANDLGKLDDLNQLSRYICAHRPEPSEIRTRLSAIEQRPVYSFQMQIFIYAVISGSFSVFFRRRSSGHDRIGADWNRVETSGIFFETQFSEFSDHSLFVLWNGWHSG